MANVWVFVEEADEEPSPLGLELLTKARDLGDVTATYLGEGNDDAFATPVDTSLLVPAPGVLGNDVDPNGDSLTTELETAPTDGILDLAADGGFTFTPDPGFDGVDSFTYRASDGVLASPPAVVTIAVGSGCGDLTLENQTIDTTETFEACGSIFAGNGLTIGSNGDVVLRAGVRVILTDGFATEAGAELAIEVDPTLAAGGTAAPGGD